MKVVSTATSVVQKSASVSSTWSLIAASPSERDAVLSVSLESIAVSSGVMSPPSTVVGADQAFYDMYPKSADPDTAMPYVMWPGTPYQHLMIPVK